MGRLKYVAIVVTGMMLVGASAEGCEAELEGGSGGGGEAVEGTVGEPVELAGTEYVVTNVEKTKQIGDNDFGDTADGTFIVVNLQITNKKDETKTFDQSMAKYVAPDDTKYEPAQVLQGDTLFLKDMQPDLPTKGTIVFDVPPAKAEGGELQIEDLFGEGVVKVKLP